MTSLRSIGHLAVDSAIFSTIWSSPVCAECPTRNHNIVLRRDVSVAEMIIPGTYIEVLGDGLITIAALPPVMSA